MGGDFRNLVHSNLSGESEKGYAFPRNKPEVACSKEKKYFTGPEKRISIQGLQVAGGTGGIHLLQGFI